MKKIIKLNESDLLKIVNKVIKEKKNLINEDAVGKEPILRGPIGTGTFYFDKGATVPNMWNGQKVSEPIRKNLVQAVSECIDYNLTKETRLEMEMVSDMRVILIKGSILQ